MTSASWTDRIKAIDARADELRYALAPLADERARIIADEVAARGRGGRQQVAADLEVTVAQVDQAIKRARTALRPSGLPFDLLERLYALEVAELPPLAAHLWQSLAQTLQGTFIDATWIEQPGEIIAQEVEDATGDDEEFLPEDSPTMAAAARSWTRMQALAVLDAIQRRGPGALPATEKA